MDYDLRNGGALNACRVIEGGGMGNMGLSLTLMPGYDERKYPFVLVKENTFFYILHPFDNYVKTLLNY